MPKVSRQDASELLGVHPDTFTVKKLKKKIHFKQQKINKLDAKILRLKESKVTGHFTVPSRIGCLKAKLL